MYRGIKNLQLAHMADDRKFAATMRPLTGNILHDNSTLYTNLMERGDFYYKCAMNMKYLIAFCNILPGSFNEKP